MTVIHRLASRADLERGIEMAREVLRRSEAVAFPVEHGYAVACEPFSLPAIQAIQRARGATGNALPLLVGSQQTVEGIAKPLAPEVRTMLTALWPGLLTIVVAAAVPWDLGDGGSGVVAVRQPQDPVALALLRIGPLAATSAAPSGATSLNAQEVAESLGDAVALILDDGPRPAGPASTMVAVEGKGVQVLRDGAVPVDLLTTYGQGLEIRS